MADFVAELRPFQNLDGGFGHGIEPDLLSPDSSPFATTVGLQYLNRISRLSDAAAQMVARALDYLVVRFDPGLPGWRYLEPPTVVYPSAPWWEYDYTLQSDEWGNPNAEILGHFLRHRHPSSGRLLEDLWPEALGRLAAIEVPEFHELLCFQRLFHELDRARQDEIWPSLTAHMLTAVEMDRDRGDHYGADALTFVRSPTSPFRILFPSEEIGAGLDRLTQRAVAGERWVPNWTWNDAFPEAWPRARGEWTSFLTRMNLAVLDAFDALDP
ncbi:MAG: hypothetical protein AAF567_06260 [Actinomycetota bacterium]